MREKEEREELREVQITSTELRESCDETECTRENSDSKRDDVRRDTSSFGCRGDVVEIEIVKSIVRIFLKVGIRESTLERSSGGTDYS